MIDPELYHNFSVNRIMWWCHPWNCRGVVSLTESIKTFEPCWTTIIFCQNWALWNNYWHHVKLNLIEKYVDIVKDWNFALLSHVSVDLWGKCLLLRLMQFHQKYGWYIRVLLIKPVIGFNWVHQCLPTLYI